MIRRRSLIPLALVVALAACTTSAARSSDPGAGDTTPSTSGPAAPTPWPGVTDTAPASTLWAPATTAVGSPPVDLPADWDSFDDSLADALVGKGAWGISVAVAKDGQVVHAGARGVADPVGGRGAGPDDRYRLASNSKVLTAIAVLQLVEDGSLQLDEPATPRLAARLGVTITDPAVATITVRQLLNQTSGFTEYQRTFFNSRVNSCEEAAAVGLTGSARHPPGTDFTYSNMNYCLLGLLVQDVTGRPYEEFVKERLLEPLGIEGMRLAGTHDVRDGDAHHLSGASRNYMEVLFSAGAWVGTASDLVRIVDSLDPSRAGWHPLSAETFAAMLVRADADFPYTSRWYGFGLRVWDDGSWGHTGTVENARSMVLHRPDGITWAVMVNGDAPSDTDDLRDLVDEALLESGVTSPG